MRPSPVLHLGLRHLNTVLSLFIPLSSASFELVMSLLAKIHVKAVISVRVRSAWPNVLGAKVVTQSMFVLLW